MAVQIVALALGLIATILNYPEYNKFMFAILAVIAAIATGVVVYLLVVDILGRVIRRPRP